MEDVIQDFHWVDYLIFGITLLIPILIGLYYTLVGGGQKTTKEFLIGDRKMPLIPTTLSLLVSFQSGIFMLGISSEMYVKGTNFVWYLLGIVIGLPLAAIVYLPIFYKLQLTSAFEYLELRFRSKIVRQIGSLLYMSSNLGYTAIVLYAPAVALNAVSGFNLELLIVVSGLACTVYTAMGGLKAVVWTDAFQAVIMYAGFIAIIAQGTLDVGGVREVWKRAFEGGRIITDFSPNPFVYMNFWTVSMGTAFGWMNVYGTNQACVQRYISLPTLRKAQLSLFLVIPGILIMFPMICMSGLVMYAYYHKCDPLKLGFVKDRDQLLPYFTVEILHHIPGLPGIFMACLYSGTMSTVSSCLNSIAAVIWEDFLKDKYQRKLTDFQQTKITKITAFIVGIAAIGLACLAKYLGGVLQAGMTVLSVMSGPLAGLFLLGMIFPWANKRGAIIGVLVAAIVTVWICIAAQIIKPYGTNLPSSVSHCSNDSLDAAGFLYKNGTLSDEFQTLLDNQNEATGVDQDLHGINTIYKLSYKLYGLLAIVLVFIVGMPASALFNGGKLDTDDIRYVWPGIRRFCCCCLPRTWLWAMEKMDKNEECDISFIHASDTKKPPSAALQFNGSLQPLRGSQTDSEESGGLISHSQS